MTILQSGKVIITSDCADGAARRSIFEWLVRYNTLNNETFGNRGLWEIAAKF